MDAVIPQAGAIEAQAMLARGDVTGAGRLADELLADRSTGASLVPRARLQRDMALARIRLAQGRPDEAGALLRPLAIEARASRSDPYLASMLVLQACVEDASGNRPEALAALRDAVRLAAPGGYVRRLVEDGLPLRGLLPAVRGEAPAFVDAVVHGMAVEAAVPGGADAHASARAARAAGSSGGVDAARPEAPVEPLVEPLTARELDVLRLMARGTTNAGIAAELVVSLATAKWHVGNVLGKLGVTSRTQALVRGQRLGLV